MGTSSTEGPPDKRRDLRASNRKKNGRALINGRIEVEYAEKDQNCKITKYWGWCEGTIIAYSKKEGYLVTFDDRCDPKTKEKVDGWTDWIEDLNSGDVRLQNV